MEEYRTYYFKVNPRARKFPFMTRGKVPKLLYGTMSLNELLVINNRMMMNDKKQKWGDFGVWLAGKYGLSDKGISNSIIEFRIYGETKAKRDLDNLAAGIKFLNDGLFVTSGMYIDDNYNHINPLVIVGDYDKDHPRTEIRITVFEEEVTDIYEKVKIHVGVWEGSK